MSTPTRCERCARPKSANWDPEKCQNPDDPSGCECRECVRVCWGECESTGYAIDWRARCLKAEAALSLLSAPLSPEALQAIAEESAE